MANPIVVFVVPGRYGNALTNKMPAGVKADGSVEKAMQNSEYSLLLLDDLGGPPEDAPCVVRPDESLLIIVHNTMPKQRLFGVQYQTICERFSQHSGDPVFVKLGNILTGKSSKEEIEKEIADFVQLYKNRNYLTVLDGLAAISQIHLLINEEQFDPNDDHKQLYELREQLNELRESLLSQCPTISNRKFNNLPARCQIHSLQEEANSLQGLATESANGSGSDGA